MRCADGCVKQVRGEPDFDACSLSSWLVSSGPVAGCPRCLPAGSAKPPGPSEGPAVSTPGASAAGAFSAPAVSVLVAVSGVFWSPLAQRPRRAQRPPLGRPCDATTRQLRDAPDRGTEGRRRRPGRIAACQLRPDRRALPDLVRPDWERRPRPGGLAAPPRGRRLHLGAEHPCRDHGRPLRPRPYLGLLNSKAAAPRHLKYPAALSCQLRCAYGAADESDDD